jgi:pimeloyl-ACP methyl ester carboxylesterase
MFLCSNDFIMAVWVLLHGLNETPQMFAHWEKLQALHSCVFPTLPPFGKAAVPEDFDGTIDWYAEYAVKQIPDGAFRIAGHSMGGYIGLTIAEKFKERVEKLVLINSTAAADSPERIENRNRQIALLDSDPEVYFRAFFQALLPGESPIRRTERFRELTEQTSQIPLEALKKVIAGLRDRRDMRTLLQEKKINCHYIAGGQDALLPAQAISAEARESESGLTIIENSGHLSPWEVSVEVEELLCSF